MTGSLILWIAATYGLRSQIQRYFRRPEDWEIGISPFLTFCFPVVYIYCLNPVTRSDYRNLMISLDLHSSPQSRHLRK